MLPCLFSILLTFLSSYPLSNVVSGIVKKYVILFYLSFRRISNPCEKKNLFGKNTFHHYQPKINMHRNTPELLVFFV